MKKKENESFWNVPLGTDQCFKSDLNTGISFSLTQSTFTVNAWSPETPRNHFCSLVQVSSLTQDSCFSKTLLQLSQISHTLRLGYLSPPTTQSYISYLPLQDITHFLLYKGNAETWNKGSCHPELFPCTVRQSSHKAFCWSESTALFIKLTILDKPRWKAFATSCESSFMSKSICYHKGKRQHRQIARQT